MRGKHRVRRWGLTLVAAGSATLSACSSSHHGGPAATSSPSPPGGLISQTALPPTGPLSPDAIGISPGGVTTSVNVPADSSEEEYGQACRAAKVWMDQHGGDPQTLIERYLATLQAPGAAAGIATFHVPWAQLTPARQAAVIVAVRAAAGDQCG